MKNEINRDLLKSLLILATVIEARDAYTGGHTWRVSQYAKKIALKAGFPEEMVFMSQLGGLVHDIGKVAVPDSILNKKGKLDENEYAIMKNHPLIGQEVIESHPLAQMVQTAVAQHHERIDGLGYPHGRTNDDLSDIGKVIGVADAFDAMTSTRPYRTALPVEKALYILEEEKSRQFDSQLAQIMIGLARQDEICDILNHCVNHKPMLSCPVCGPVITPSDKSGDGDKMICPACTGEFIMHKSGDSFELEWKGSATGKYVPQADHDTIDHFLAMLPGK